MKQIFSNCLLGIIAVSIFAATNAHSGEVAFRISNDTIGGGIEGDLGNSGLIAGFEHFYKEKSASINISNVNLHTKGQTAIANMPTTVMLGLEATRMKEGGFKGAAIAFGGNIRVNIPASPGLSTELRAHYAPDIVAYDDADRYTHVRAQLNYRVIQSADISAGYQYLNAGVKDSSNDRTFESGLFLGLRTTF